MPLTQARQSYKPFEYPKAFEFYLTQRRAHWSVDKLSSMVQDVQNWNSDATESERLVLGQIINGFVQTEFHVLDYWSGCVAKWFPKPEIAMMANTFSHMEAIHAEAYAHLNDTLGLTDYSAFLKDPTVVAKLDRLTELKPKTLSEKAVSLAIFSAFTEGVNLFSSFAVLMNLSRAPWNLFKMVNNIVLWSVKDEDLHSQAGCWLFCQLMAENPKLFNDDLKTKVYDAARLTVQLEDDFIDNAFSLGEIRGLDPKDLKCFIRMRANAKLQDLGLKSNWRNIDKAALERMSWFEMKVNGKVNKDFFDSRPTEYQTVNWKFEEMFGEWIDEDLR